jgi:glycosyltransferase involved in cell wall biosynthesis
VDKIVIEAVDNLIRSKYASHLKFLSNVPLSDLIKLYGAADLFVHASYFETSANVVLEAMASAKPAVITQTGLYKELSELSFGGTVTPVGNSFLLSKAIINMLSLDEQSKLNMGNINRQIVEQHFSVESWADRLEKVLQVLI